MGNYWCAWNDRNSSCLIANGASLPQVLQLDLLELFDDSPSCIVMLSDNELVCGTEKGKLICADINRECITEQIQLSINPVQRIWDDGCGGLISIDIGELKVYHLRKDHTFSVSEHRLLLDTDITSAELSNDRQYFCLSSRSHLYFFSWEVRSTPYHTLHICQSQHDENITRISWDPADKMVLICTSQRLVSYDTCEHWLSTVSDDPLDIVEWSPLGKLFVICSHGDSTLLQLFDYVSCGNWRSLGYTDLSACFGIRQVQKLVVMKNLLYLFHGGLCRSYCIECTTSRQ